MAIAASTAPAAFADPVAGGGKPVTPKSYDIVSVGADTDQFLFDQLSADYNKTITPAEHSAKHPWFLRLGRDQARFDVLPADEDHGQGRLRRRHPAQRRQCRPQGARRQRQGRQERYRPLLH